MELSVFDLSKQLGVAQDTIERWVRQGKLPVIKKGRNYRFDAKELKKWASNHNIKLNFYDKKNMPQKERLSVIPLSVAVQNGGVYFDIQGHDVNSALQSSIEKISMIPDDFKSDLLDRLIEREKALSTGIGNGIAIPHPREQLNYLKNPLVSVCFLDNPVDYKALDNKSVSVLFFILCPDLKMHLHLLSALSFCLRDHKFIEFLKSGPDYAGLIEKIEIIQKTNPI
ncbi:MAG: PTS transporter subunit EIIA [Desulfobacula sp.]|jgi:PTS system nitrogen regulatory IIA component|uniref:PTS sugar transporter subunit IIA n=1 Tax=Desulfobacula sp. TaxID=2593537 RepID=UPI001DC81EDD|nr:PTS transporter subunit EIIA [Desulfobacula sp.]MBT3485910.1 PTS transporter subunit EIIA [Desulfobacula sp.]MBT3805445.1 PTS transporter subunit EIIA [Desulfobacula sp.]MBT4025986.1 PTS transporter subunit EIIA [Desulfobacula sp.]MBT4199095.1 PTS transporter subunit EIIA [Desulfobacula sp.]